MSEKPISDLRRRVVEESSMLVVYRVAAMQIAVDKLHVRRSKRRCGRASSSAGAITDKDKSNAGSDGTAGIETRSLAKPGYLRTLSSQRVKAMVMVLGNSIRAFLVRSLAVVTVVLTYAFGNIGTQVLSVAGISALGATVTATPANAHRRYRRRRRFYGFWPYRHYRRRRYRRRHWW